MGYADKKDIKKLEKKLNILIFSSIMAWVFWTVLFLFIFVGFARADYLFPLKEPVYVGKKILCTSWYSKYRTENGKTYQYKAWNLPAKYGSEILCPENGVIINTQIAGYEGAIITIKFDDGNEMTFCHLSKYEILKGRVSTGSVIGYVGTSGRSTGPHVRIRIDKNGERQFISSKTWGLEYNKFYYSPTEFNANKAKYYLDI